MRIFTIKNNVTVVYMEIFTLLHFITKGGHLYSNFRSIFIELKFAIKFNEENFNENFQTLKKKFEIF